MHDRCGCRFTFGGIGEPFAAALVGEGAVLFEDQVAGDRVEADHGGVDSEVDDLLADGEGCHMGLLSAAGPLGSVALKSAPW